MIAVLIGTALLALTMVAFYRFSHSILRVASNQQKKSAMASADASLKALLGNRLACLATVSTSHLDYASATEQRPFTIYERLTASGAPRAVYSEGGFLSGVLIKELGALVGPDTRNARLVRVRVRMEKTGNALHETSVEQNYYLHVMLDSANNPAECYLVDGPVQLTMVKVHDQTIPATGASSVIEKRASMFVSNPAMQPNPVFAPPGWETLPTTAIPPSGCRYNGEDGAPACPVQYGPSTPVITAQGNRLVYSFTTRVSMGIGGAIIGGGFPPSYPFYLVGSTAPVPSPPYYRMDPMAFGATLAVRLMDGATAVKESVVSISNWHGSFGFMQQSITTVLVASDVEYGKNYTFGLGFSTQVAAMSPPPTPVPPPPPPPPALPPPPMPPAYSFYFINWFEARGTVLHYIATPPL